VVIRDPAPELDTSFLDLPTRRVGVTHAMRSEPQRWQLPGRLDEILADLSRPLVVTPVPDPDHIIRLLAIQWFEDRRVRGLVERPDAANAEFVAVDLSQRGA